ncbi:MAG: hypothetical protein L7U83_10375 [Akkermansiaceae bacterium]|nr:hypothetical protein [Akkermansiaceae bacterium]
MSNPAFFIGKNFPARFLFLLLLHKLSWCRHLCRVRIHEENRQKYGLPHRLTSFVKVSGIISKERAV